jgi:surface antigen
LTVLTSAQVQKIAAGAGFTGNNLNIAVAIAQAESGFRADATNTNKDGSIDRGLWQINSVHTEYIPTLLLADTAYNASAAWTISRNGTNWTPWSTYTSGAYKKFLAAGVPTAATVKAGSRNSFPKGQCTWWADDRYHTLTGYYVPWSGNANQWLAGAKQYGWNTSGTPPKNIASIMILQAGIQLADATYGHVGVVEKVNADGTIYTSDQNWGSTTAARASTSYVTFHTGAGVSFAWANDNASGTNSTTQIGGILGTVLSPAVVANYDGILDQVHATLTSNDGFYGMALALDQAEQLPGWINLANGPFDIPGVIRSVGATVLDNATPVGIRSALIVLGMFILFMLVTKIVLDVGENGINIVGKVLPLAAAGA